jgi:hypothetical protein
MPLKHLIFPILPHDIIEIYITLNNNTLQTAQHHKTVPN